jgi:integrase
MSILHAPGSGLSPWGAPVPIALDVFTTEILAMYRPPMRAKGTYAKFRLVLSIVAELAGEGATTAAFNPQTVAAYITRRCGLGLSNNTVVGELATLRAACSYAESRCYLNVSPFRLRRSWLRRTPTKGKRHLSLAEIARVLERAQLEALQTSGDSHWRAARLQALIATVAYTGLRRDEALHLQVEDIDLAERMISLVVRNGHGATKTERSAQPIPIPPELAEILAVWLPATESIWAFPGFRRKTPWTGGVHGSKPLDRVKALGKRAGVDGVTFQILRHSWATAGEIWGLTDLQIQRVLRHTTVRTQGHYRHADIVNMRALSDVVSFKPAPAPGGPHD